MKHGFPEDMGGIVLLAAALSGCATTSSTPPEPRVVIQEKLVPVHTPCTPPNVAAEPAYPDTDDALKAATPTVRYLLIIAGRVLRIARLGVVEPVVEGCRK